MEHHVNLVHNIPFFSVFFAMFCGIITPLLKSGRAARHLHGFMVGLVGILSVVLLVSVVKNQEAYTFMMGHFPAPWGNELRIGPLEALLAVMVSVVMFLTITAGSRQIFEEIVPEKQKFYFIMLNATYGAMLAMTYTNDMFTGYVFIEILTIASCTLILARGTKQAIVGTTHYLVFGCMGSGLFLLGVCILYGITGQLLFPQMKETIGNRAVSFPADDCSQPDVCGAGHQERSVPVPFCTAYGLRLYDDNLERDFVRSGAEGIYYSGNQAGI